MLNLLQKKKKKIKHRKARTGEANNPAGFPEEKETSKLILEQWECGNISHPGVGGEGGLAREA